MLCFSLLPLAPHYAESLTAKVPVSRWIARDERGGIESRLGLRVTEEGSRDGTFVVVARENEARVRVELDRLKLLQE